jgi:hypothetical protein
MTKEPGKTIEHIDPATSLPSPHIDHSRAFADELDSRLIGFDGAIAALADDIDGSTKAHEADMAERQKKHLMAIGEKERIKRDIERARRMALRAVEVYAEPIPDDDQA